MNENSGTMLIKMHLEHPTTPSPPTHTHTQLSDTLHKLKLKSGIRWLSRNHYPPKSFSFCYHFGLRTEEGLKS